MNLLPLLPQLSTAAVVILLSVQAFRFVRARQLARQKVRINARKRTF